MNCSKIHAIWLVVPETMIKLKHIFCKIANEKEITDRVALIEGIIAYIKWMLYTLFYNFLYIILFTKFDN